MPIDTGSKTVDASSLVDDVKSKLSELTGLIGEAKGVTPKDKARLESVVASFNELSTSLGYEPGDDPEFHEEKPEPTGRIGLEAGNKDVKPVY